MQHYSNTMWIDFNTIEHYPLLDNTKSMCENAKWHLWAANDSYLTFMTFMSYYDNLLACKRIVINTYDWKLTYYEHNMNLLWLTNDHEIF